MRVAIFTETFLPKIDGIVTVVCLLLDHLTARGIDTVVVAPQMGVERYRDTPVIGVPGVTLPQYPDLKVGPAHLGTYRQVKAFQPDIIHCFHPVLIGIPGLMMAKRLGVPALASFHLDVGRLVHHFHLSFLEPMTDFLTRLVFNQADYALAPSRVMLDYMQRLGIERVGLWRRGVDADRFHPRFSNAAMRAALTDGQPDDLLLLYVGRLSTEKRLADLRAVLESVLGTRLALVGDGPARADLEAVFAGLPVKFTGFLGGEALAQAYASADVFVFPSALETFGLVVVEALAAGLPVVASRVGGVPDVIRAGQTGYTFEIGDAAGLIDGVRRLAADAALRAAMRLNARAYAETQSWDAIMDEVIDHYARLIAGSAADSARRQPSR